MSTKPVGIDAIAAYIPRLYLDLTAEWAEGRSGTDGSEKLRSKVVQGIGISRMAQADVHEDAVTLAANAVKKLIDQSGIDPTAIASIAVGTESAVDQSKSMASYVLGLIERHYDVDLSEVSCPHFQFACIGATYALEAALNALKAGTSLKPYHIVVATDIAKYPLGSVGEPTQGAGAVAMLVSENPRLIELDAHTIGTCTIDESDFYRPPFAKSALVDGKRSVTVYCDALERATRSFLSRSERAPRDFDRFAAYLFHVPFPKMAEYAAVRQFRTLWASDPRRSELMASIKSDLVAKEELALRRHPEFKAQYAKLIKPSLALPEQIGNIYSGSLYLALVSLIETSRQNGVEVAGQDVLFSSYGSGACAKVFRGTFQPGWRDAYRDDLSNELKDVSNGGRRLRITLAQYERLHERVEYLFVSPDFDGPTVAAKDVLPIIKADGQSIALRQPSGSIVPPENEFFLKEIGTKLTIEATDIGYRHYAFANAKQVQVQ